MLFLSYIFCAYLKFFVTLHRFVEPSLKRRKYRQTEILNIGYIQIH